MEDEPCLLLDQQFLRRGRAGRVDGAESAPRLFEGGRQQVRKSPFFRFISPRLISLLEKLDGRRYGLYRASCEGR